MQAHQPPPSYSASLAATKAFTNNREQHVALSSAAAAAAPDQARLEYVANPRPGDLYLVRFAVPEFTSLCPVTGQPDFAHLVIDYAPDATIVESKSDNFCCSCIKS